MTVMVHVSNADWLYFMGKMLPSIALMVHVGNADWLYFMGKMLPSIA
jgi:hypothetical protein